MADITKNIRVLNENTIQLTADAKEGDTIDLKALSQVDFSFIRNLIDEKEEKELKDRFASIKKQAELEANTKLESQKNSYEKQLLDLTHQKENLILKTKNDLENQKLTLEKKYDNQITELNNQIANLKRESESTVQLKLVEQKENLEKKISNLNAQLSSNEKDKKLEINQLENQYKEQLTEKQNKINQFQLEKDNALKAKEIELDNIYRKQIDDLKDQVSKLNLNKASFNVKGLGEQLEQWCLKEYQNYQTAGFPDCTFTKATTNISDELNPKGTKPDFLFRVYSDSGKKNELTSVCLEMKNESNISTNKKHNSDYYKRLDENRCKNNCKYALLVSELDWRVENDAPIYKVPDYKDMYMVRPQYFISFLSIVYSLAQKYKELISENSQLQDNFQNEEEILKSFEDMKKTYMEKPIEGLAKEIQAIQDSAQSITDASNKIKETCFKITTETIETIKEKINRFNIKKIANKVKQLNS